MVFNRRFLNGFLMGLFLIAPISGFGVVSSPIIDPVVVENINSGSDNIDISIPNWQKINTGASTNNHKLFINDIGEVNQINLSNTGNPTGYNFDPPYDNSNSAGDERYSITSVPEPMTILLLGLGSIGLAAYRRKRKQK